MKKCLVFISILVCLALLAVSCTNNGGVPNDTAGESLPDVDGGNRENEIPAGDDDATTEATDGDATPDLGDGENDNTEETTEVPDAETGNSVNPGIGGGGYGKLEPI